MGRAYRDSLERIRRAVSAFNSAEVDFVIQLGDLIDTNDDGVGELAHLQVAEAEYARCLSPRHYVLGNHCVSGLTKEEFRRATGAREPNYSFDVNGWHFVVLDSCFRCDEIPYGRCEYDWRNASVPGAQLDWLGNDLSRNKLPVIVFSHHRLDIEGDYAATNGAAVRSVLEQTGRVKVVLQGHHHRNDCGVINGVHYLTLTSLVEGRDADDTAYAMMSCGGNGRMRIDGIGRQASYSFTNDPESNGQLL